MNDALAEARHRLAIGLVREPPVVEPLIADKWVVNSLLQKATDEARSIGASNTLTFRDGLIHAANTDAGGFLAALTSATRVQPQTALVLGAGGSARAVVFALRAIGADVQIWNRTRARAEALGSYTEDAVQADVLVNCTSVGLDDSSSEGGTFKTLPILADALGTYATVVDLVYRHGGETELAGAARRAGCTVVDGLEILVHQGALSFEAWTGRPGPLDVMRAGARGTDETADEPGNTTATSAPRAGP